MTPHTQARAHEEARAREQDRSPVRRDVAVSADGTQIGYRQVGVGPALVIVHGSLSTSAHHSELAAALSQHFTATVYDRRGFGESSGAIGSTLERDIEDVAAVLDKAGAHNLAGYSLGAIVALAAAAALPGISKLAVYEPPLFPDRDSAAKVTNRLDRELADGRTAAAIVTAMKGAQLASPWFNAVPRVLLEPMMRSMMTYGEKEGQGDYPSFRQLAPTLGHDGHIILEMSGRQHWFSNIRADTLLLGGAQSSSFLKAALSRLAETIPHARRVEIPGVGHSAGWNSNLRGNPGPVASAFAEFFA
jgi:pimeloyl-ACP methyl ester carboxylesterase